MYTCIYHRNREDRMNISQSQTRETYVTTAAIFLHLVVVRLMAAETGVWAVLSFYFRWFIFIFGLNQHWVGPWSSLVIMDHVYNRHALDDDDNGSVNEPRPRNRVKGSQCFAINCWNHQNKTDKVWRNNISQVSSSISLDLWSQLSKCAKIKMDLEP